MILSEHIKELLAQAEDDLGAAEALRQTGYYGHALFWGHLTLEKACKALWIKTNGNENYPFIHNLLRLIRETNIAITDNQIQFYSDMNQFQAHGRYPDTLHTIENTVTKEVCEKYLSIAKEQLSWIQQQII